MARCMCAFEFGKGGEKTDASHGRSFTRFLGGLGKSVCWLFCFDLTNGSSFRRGREEQVMWSVIGVVGEESRIQYD